MSAIIPQSKTTELDEMLVLVADLTESQRKYFFARARGAGKEEATQDASVSPSTVASWPYQGRTSEAFKRVRDILKSNPKAEEHLLDYFIRIGTKLSVAEEVWGVSRKEPRTDVLRLGAEMSGALDRGNNGPQVSVIVLSDNANQAWVQAIQKKQNQLNMIDLPGEADGK